MKPLLVLRPEPGADSTVRRAQAKGLSAIPVPLFEIVTVDWTPPNAVGFDAVLMTSAHAARRAGKGLEGFRDLPLFAAGAATADAARAAGFTDILAGERDGNAVLAIAAERGVKRLLHLAGRDHMGLSHPQLNIERRIVYAASPVPSLPASARAALRDGAVALLHSPRAAKLFGTLADAEGFDRSGIAIAALSPAVRDAAGQGWKDALAAPAPNDDALLAIAAQLCDQDNGCSIAGCGEDRT